MDRAAFGQRLKEIRQAAGMTQAQVANEIRVDSPSIARWERGFSVPRIEALARLAILYDRSLDDFVDWDEAEWR